MTTLDDLVAALPGAALRGPSTGARIVDATHDSRQVHEGWLFCAVRGETTDGHEHAPAAVAAGAVALIVDHWLDLDVPQIRVPDVRAAMGPAAAVVHGHPSRDLRIAGITGTNGKTTTVYLLEAAFGAAAVGTGIIGTVETRIHGEAVPGVRTTPEGTDLQRLLARMRTRGAEAVAMEVSSHGLDLHRVDGTRFAVVAFTNLSQDHLDWHGTMEAYYRAKARLFSRSFSDRGVVSVGDDWGRRLAAESEVPVVTVGGDEGVTYRILDADTSLEGGRARVQGPGGEHVVVTRLLGEFNLRNAALAHVVAVEMGIDPAAAVAGIAACPGVPGRLEQVASAGPTVLVDYAHTPDAVERVVATLRGLLPPGGRLHVVLGCGGDRDRGKRPLMGAAAARSDHAVLTSDNPRSEDPLEILDAMVAGAEEAVEAGAPARLSVEPDRRRAIELALRDAAADDVVLIAGKGHETGQELADRTVPFDDRLVAVELAGGGAP